jgi:four helix bundle protein
MDRTELEARSMKFASEIKVFCEELRNNPLAWQMVRQLMDASSSMAANYRATSRARSRKEWVAKLGVVVEESDEAVFWLEFADQSELSNALRIAPLLTEARELRAIFAASYATSRRNNNQQLNSSQDGNNVVRSQLVPSSHAGQQGNPF